MAKHSDNASLIALLTECLDDCVTEDNPVRVIEVFVDKQDVTDGKANNHPAKPAF